MQKIFSENDGYVSCFTSLPRHLEGFLAMGRKVYQNLIKMSPHKMKVGHYSFHGVPDHVDQVDFFS